MRVRVRVQGGRPVRCHGARCGLPSVWDRCPGARLFLCVFVFVVGWLVWGSLRRRGAAPDAVRDRAMLVSAFGSKTRAEPGERGEAPPWQLRAPRARPSPRSVTQGGGRCSSEGRGLPCGPARTSAGAGCPSFPVNAPPLQELAFLCVGKAVASPFPSAQTPRTFDHLLDNGETLTLGWYLGILGRECKHVSEHYLPQKPALFSFFFSLGSSVVVPL